MPPARRRRPRGPCCATRRPFASRFSSPGSSSPASTARRVLMVPVIALLARRVDQRRAAVARSPFVMRDGRRGARSGRAASRGGPGMSLGCMAIVRAMRQRARTHERLGAERAVGDGTPASSHACAGARIRFFLVCWLPAEERRVRAFVESAHGLNGPLRAGRGSTPRSRRIRTWELELHRRPERPAHRSAAKALRVDSGWRNGRGTAVRMCKRSLHQAPEGPSLYGRRIRSFGNTLDFVGRSALRAICRKECAPVAGRHCKVRCGGPSRSRRARIAALDLAAIGAMPTRCGSFRAVFRMADERGRNGFHDRAVAARRAQAATDAMFQL
ncbi:hypothetical protein BTN_4095 [Burkholderia thailandensis E254]|nr:hypothetical protein BTN_4095 [Burkholderia thailandensis E254]